LVLLPPDGPAEVRFTHDWSRVRCLDPQADTEWIEALAAELRDHLRQMNGDRDFILGRLQDSFSNALQPSEFKACLAASPAEEANELARIYLERRRPGATREMSSRQTILRRMQQEFENIGAWRLMRKEIRAADFTRSGDPLKIDCGYAGEGSIKLFQAVAVESDPNSAKVLAFSFPRLAEGIRRVEARSAELTAIVQDDLVRDDEGVSFALETLRQQQIRVAPLAQMPVIAATAARELGLA
ncbi:MAG TPA: DUF3037 domain-containing protein, partial [Candidatus Limnocylindrales bacterium]|nr:DUF3037 domain-containing protein [Candidatus Limnocylindrales bacterium]